MKVKILIILQSCYRQLIIVHRCNISSINYEVIYLLKKQNNTWQHILQTRFTHCECCFIIKCFALWIFIYIANKNCEKFLACDITNSIIPIWLSWLIRSLNIVLKRIALRSNYQNDLNWNKKNLNRSLGWSWSAPEWGMLKNWSTSIWSETVSNICRSAPEHSLLQSWSAPFSFT